MKKEPKKQKRKLVGPLTHPPEPKYQPKVPCGARTRSGAPCQKPALPGKKRCKLHGGASTGAPGNTNATVHRLYGAGFTPQEHAFLMEADEFKGTLEGELEALRVSLFRASICQKIWLEHKGILAKMEDEAPMEEYMREHGLWDSITLHTETGQTGNVDPEGFPIDINKKRVERRQRDFTKEIKEITEKIRRLEETHQKLIQERQDPDNVAKIAEDLQAFYANAAKLMPGGNMEPENEPAEE